ncbi:hypothetical protein BBJK_02332 [Bifidobacterium bifidum LMG 13195]|uniref:Uncharacterized protein n=1 Tax=Bifidobacterium bifidum LMG 13195 TaxID=1207542 RepID=A0A286TE45_BIFBI|nr:hypothetical protein BBJK_02332 [Bifidobacterium bifidum LMG 13195]
MQRDRGLAGAGPPCTTRALLRSERMMRSCSAWIVATMSVILPVRRELSDASRAPSPVSVPAFEALSTCSEWTSSTSSSMPMTSRKFSVIWRRMTMSPWLDGVAS